MSEKHYWKMASYFVLFELLFWGSIHHVVNYAWLLFDGLKTLQFNWIGFIISVASFILSIYCFKKFVETLGVILESKINRLVRKVGL